jgi:hypothetical protein
MSYLLMIARIEAGKLDYEVIVSALLKTFKEATSDDLKRINTSCSVNLDDKNGIRDINFGMFAYMLEEKTVLVNDGYVSIGWNGTEIFVWGAKHCTSALLTEMKLSAYRDTVIVIK